ncbi:prostaglandin E synthase 2-like [Rhopilema esculentum]|uniref:prostaglandin E synthase 2-like n=1 Tax=Rhopilema esculentum TaxID=499914 RepID=UPI0031E3D2CB|eukprot:gene10996-19836_t
METSRRTIILARNIIRSTKTVLIQNQPSQMRVSTWSEGLRGTLFSLRNKKQSSFLKRAGSLAAGFTGGIVMVKSFSDFSVQALPGWFVSLCMNDTHEFASDRLDTSDDFTLSKESPNLKVKLYQYENCPFCCKVRAFLDYYGIEYEKIEVNPLLRKEIKFSEYRKVPIVIVNESQQLNDSSLIISILRSYMLGKGSLDSLLAFYPKIEVEGSKGKKFEYQNRHNVMYREAMGTKDEALAVKEEMKWRKWVDSSLVHMLSPNIYRTMVEAHQAFDYFSSAGNFSAFERFMARYCGAVFMYVVSKNLKKRYNLKDDVRQSLYEDVNQWVKAVGKKREFMGGDRPNLADLGVYGVLNAIEGLDAFNDMMKNTNIKPWYQRMKKAVSTKEGHAEYENLIAKLS